MAEGGNGGEHTVDGVIIKLPEKYQKLHPKKVDIDLPFWVIRVVTNFKFYDDNDEVADPEFDPPFEMHVPYTKADMDEAKRRNMPLQLADWDGNKWVRFTKEDHDFELVGDDSGGYGKVLISEWADPPIAWGT
jgi:hypothetical protein